VKAPLADLLLPEDIQRGYVYEPHPTASVLDWLLQAVQQWEAEGGEAQVGCVGTGVDRLRGKIWAVQMSAHSQATLGGRWDLLKMCDCQLLSHWLVRQHKDRALQRCYGSLVSLGQHHDSDQGL
jgi:hypothetical protein